MDCMHKQVYEELLINNKKHYIGVIRNRLYSYPRASSNLP